MSGKLYTRTPHPVVGGTSLVTTRLSRRSRSRSAARVWIFSGVGALGLVAVLVVSALTIAGGCARKLPATSTAPVAVSSLAASAPATAVASASAASAKRAPATASASGPASASVAGSSGVVEIGWVGDTTPGSKYGSPPKNGRALFEDLRKQLQAPDLMVGNLEGTFGDGGKSKSADKNTYSFQAPPKNAESLAWAGFDVMSLANNHAWDYLEPGLSATRKALADNEIADVGLPGQITIREANGVKVAFVAFSPYRWNAPISNIPAAQKLVRKAKQQSDVVIVLIHAGAEGADKTHTPKGAEKAYGEFRGDPRAFSHAMIDAGASMVLGSGPHVIRGIERYNGKLIAYSLGNFAGWGNFGQGGNLSLSGLLTVRVDKNGEIVGGRWLSLKLADPGVPAVDKQNTSGKLVEKLSASDFSDTFEMDSNGNFGPGK